MKYSILMSTIKPIGHALSVIDNILSQSNGQECEILLFGKEDPNRDDIKFFLDEGYGSVYGYNFLLSQSIGDCIIVAVDDHHYNRWSSLFEEISEKCADKKYKILHCLSGNPNSLPDYFAVESYIDHHITHYRNVPCNLQHNTACFPVMLRETALELGCIFNPSFLHHHVDIWLGHFLSLANEPIQASSTASLSHYAPGVNRKYDLYDGSVCYKLISLKHADITLPYSHKVDLRLDDSIQDYSELCDIINTAKEFQ